MNAAKFFLVIAAASTLCPPADATTISHGPMVGHTTDSTALIWFRTDAEAEVAVEYASAGAISGYRTSPGFTTRADDDFTGTIELTGLEPETDYTYRFRIDAQSSTESWSFRTFPPDGYPAQFTFAFGSGLDHPHTSGDLEIGKVLEDNPPNLFLWLGDNTYADWKYDHDFRKGYKAIRANPNWKTFLTMVPQYALWDDHDFWDNNVKGHSLEQAKKDLTLKIFKEYWPNPFYGTDDTPGIWCNFRVADVEFFMLDNRYYRGNHGSSPMLGETQHQWLEEALARSTATFKIVANGSQWHGCEARAADQWTGFTSERDRLYGYIHDNDITGVILLSGDRHRSEVNVWDLDPQGYPLYEFSSSALQSVHKKNCGKCDTSETGYRNLWCYHDEWNVCYLSVDTRVSDPTLTLDAFDYRGNHLHTFVLHGSTIGPAVRETAIDHGPSSSPPHSWLPFHIVTDRRTFSIRGNGSGRQTLRFTVFDIHGRVIGSESLTNGKPGNSARFSLPPGIYPCMWTAGE